MTNYDPLSAANLEATDREFYQSAPSPNKPPSTPTEKEANKKTERAKREEFFRQRWQQQQAAGLLKTPKPPKGIKAGKPGARHTTSMAQRNASRRNIIHAQLVKKSRKL